MKRLVDICGSLFGIIIFSPLLFLCVVAVFGFDLKNPFYIAPRVGRFNIDFRMVKIRSMRMNHGLVASTAESDPRITPIGIWIRKFKVDEISQLFNVLSGHMSLVGPRPNVRSEVDLYTENEKTILDVKPGITDISSIVFSDEGSILKGSSDPDDLYRKIIRPYKSRLAIYYANANTLPTDFIIILLTVLNFVNRRLSLELCSKFVATYYRDDWLASICRREADLVEYDPP